MSYIGHKLRRKQINIMFVEVLSQSFTIIMVVILEYDLFQALHSGHKQHNMKRYQRERDIWVDMLLQKCEEIVLPLGKKGLSLNVTRKREEQDRFITGKIKKKVSIQLPFLL